MIRTVSQRYSLLLGAIALLPAAVALAAEASDELEAIVVVGQKENESLQKAPEAITALSSDTLIENFVRAPTDLNSQVPSLVIGQTEGYNNVVAIRGIGLNSPQDDGSPASVSFHQNGIFVPDPISLATNFLDVDHIEVLRGPQGTVFGQNAVGGTVNVITVAPRLDAVNGYVNLEYGSYDLEHVTAAVNLPVSSTFAVRAAGDFIQQQGYVLATAVPGRFQLDDKHNYHVRLSALFQPIENFSVLGTIEYSKTDQHENEAKNMLDPNPDPYQETSDWPGQLHYNQTLGGLTATYDWNSIFFKSITGLEYTNQTGSNTESGLTVALATPLYGGQNVQFWLHDIYSVTQEFEVGSRPGGALDWVVGAFYLHSRTTDGYDQYLRNPNDIGAPNILDNQQESLVAQQIADGTLYFETSNAFRRTSVSGFGQATYHVNDQLRATAGFRYTEDRNTSFLDNYFGDPNLGGGLVHLSQHTSKPTWKIGLDYQITPDNFVYSSVSTGFKPGGGNPGTAPAVVPAQYAPETITAFEVGSKNSLFDHSLILNVAGFYYIDKNMQYHAEDLINFDGGVDNLPRVDIYGFEGEFTWLMPYHFKLSGNVTAERGRIADHVSTLDYLAGNAANNAYIAQYGYDAFLAAEFGTDANGQAILTNLRRQGYRDIYGNSPPNMPEFTATLALSQTARFSNGSSLLSRLQLNYRDHYSNTVFTDPIYTTPSYTLLNLLFDYTFSNEKLNVSFAINNLTDRAAVSYRFTNQYGGETTQSYFPPREFIAGVRYRF